MSALQPRPGLQGRRVLALRVTQALKTGDLVKRARIPLGQLLALEAGQYRPGTWGTTVARLALALQTSTDYLLGLTDDPTPPPPAEAPRSLSPDTVRLRGEKVRRARQLRDLPASRLAADAGISPAYIYVLENNHAPNAYATTVAGLAQALRVSADYLLGLTNDPRPGALRGRP